MVQCVTQNISLIENTARGQAANVGRRRSVAPDELARLRNRAVRCRDRTARFGRLFGTSATRDADG